MCLPISTPPNAIAYATGAVKTRDMAIAGLAVAVTGAILLILFLPTFMRWSGIH
jgi:sodium-dependent dicarboxylate transporter 2/3/5